MPIPRNVDQFEGKTSLSVTQTDRQTKNHFGKPLMSWKFEVDFSVQSNNVRTQMTWMKQMMTVHYFNKYVSIDEDRTVISLSPYDTHYAPQVVLGECFFASERSETVLAFSEFQVEQADLRVLLNYLIFLPDVPNSTKIEDVLFVFRLNFILFWNAHFCRVRQFRQDTSKKLFCYTW